MQLNISKISLLSCLFTVSLLNLNGVQASQFEPYVDSPMHYFYSGKPINVSKEDFYRGCVPSNTSFPGDCSSLFPYDMESGAFPLLIGYSIEDVKKHILYEGFLPQYHDDAAKLSEYKFTRKILRKDLELLSVYYQPEIAYKSLKKADYIFDSTGKSIGAIFYNSQNIWHVDDVPYYQDIISLQKIDLSKKLNSKKDIYLNTFSQAFKKQDFSNEISFYSADRTDEFSEIYAILTPSEKNKNKVEGVPYIIGDKVILLQSFVPKNLLVDLSPLIFKQVIQEDIKFNKSVKDFSKLLN